MSSKITRLASEYKDILITNSLGTTSAISFDDEAAMTIFLPATWTACNLTIYAKNPVNDSYYQLVGNDGSDITITSSVALPSKALVLPDAVFPTTWIKIVTDDASNNAITVGGVSKG